MDSEYPYLNQTHMHIIDSRFLSELNAYGVPVAVDGFDSAQ